MHNKNVKIISNELNFPIKQEDWLFLKIFNDI